MLAEQDKLALFEKAVLPHLNAAHNLARWITGNDYDAEDLTQEAYLRAFKAFDDRHASYSRAWLLAIVRNICYTWSRANRTRQLTTVFDETIHGAKDYACDPETLLLRSIDKRLVQEALEQLPLEFREALILRELEGLSYKEIAEVAGIPVGTVMSRLARARNYLQHCLRVRIKPEIYSECLAPC